MTISIITACYNGRRFIGETIESVRSQTVTDWEHIIVDDGSTDGSSDYIAALAEGDRRVRLITQANQGVAAARNAGYAAISPSAQYIIFLDQDDLWMPDTLAVLLRQLEANPESVAAHGLARYLGEPPTIFQPPDIEAWGRYRTDATLTQLKVLGPEAPTTFATLVYRCRISTPGQVLIRRRAFEDVWPLDPNTAPADDWDLWLRLSQHGPFAFVDQVVIYWRQHPTNVSRAIEKMDKATRVVRSKHLRYGSYEHRLLMLYGYRFDQLDMVRGKLHNMTDMISRSNFQGAFRQGLYAVKPLLRLFALQTYTSAQLHASKWLSR